jgi:hypothetical protein
MSRVDLMAKIIIRDNGRRSDPETAATIRKELERHRAAKPVAPPPTPEQLAYAAALTQWRGQLDALTGNLSQATRKRYDVIEANSWFNHVRASTDSKTEAQDLRRQFAKGGRS